MSCFLTDDGYYSALRETGPLAPAFPTTANREAVAKQGNKNQELCMPIYEYHCEKCGKDFETLVFGDEKPACSHCDSKKVVRLMSACGFLSKGSGGETTRTAAGSSACSGCSATSCATCGS